jgi:capsular exopolysaccharide synthesis family protein
MVFQQRDTSLIVITVKRDSAIEAAKIANQLADVYYKYRLEVAQKDANEAIDKIKEQLKNQKEEVDLAEKKVEKLRVKLDVALIGNDMIAESKRLDRLEDERMNAQRRMLEKKGLISLLAKLSEDDLLELANYLTFDQMVLTTMQQIQEVDVQLSSLEADFGANHPKVLGAKAQIKKLKQTLRGRLKALRNGLKTEYLKELASYNALDVLLKEVRAKNIALQGKIRPFKNAVDDLESVRRVYNLLNANLQQQIITLQIPKNPVKIIERARPETQRVSPNLFLNVLLSIFVGLAAGVGLAYFMEYLDTSIKTADDLERILKLPVLGSIPQKVRPLIEEGPESEHGEAYRVLRTNMAFSDVASHRGAFCVLSSGAGEGKSTTVFNLAYICAQQGEKVLLVDADFRRPVQHTILGVSNRFGLTNVLLRDVPVEEAIKPTSVPNLHFLPSGRLARTSLGIIDPKRIGELIASLKTKYDIVLIDTPPLIGISDSSIIAKEVDGAILVVQYRKYPREMLLKAKQTMETLGVTAIGAVLNNINIMRDDYYYYYGQSMDYYSDFQEEDS